MNQPYHVRLRLAYTAIVLYFISALYAFVAGLSATVSLCTDHSWYVFFLFMILSMATGLCGRIVQSLIKKEVK